MALKIGDTIPFICTPVGNIPFTLLTGADGTLQVEVGPDPLAFKMALADEKNTYISEFSSRLLEVCNENFCIQGYPLMVSVKKLPEGGCYIIKQGDDPNSVLAFTGKSASVPKIARTSDSKLWAVYQFNETWAGRNSSNVYLAWSLNNGVTWLGHVRINQTQGDTFSPAVVADRNDLLHILYRQTQFAESNPGPITHTDPAASNLHYITYNGTSFGPDILITDMEYNGGYTTTVTKSMSQYFPTAVIDYDNNIHVLFTGEGHQPPDSWGNFPVSLQYVKNPTGPGSTTLDWYDYCFMQEPCALIDPYGYFHVIYIADNAVRYLYPNLGEPSTVFEQVISRGESTSFCLIPTVYSDSTIHYEPFLLMVDNRDFFCPQLIETYHNEEGWQYAEIEDLSGSINSMSGGINPSTGENEGPLILTINNHNLNDGEVIRVKWPSMPSNARRNYQVLVIDENNIELDNSENYNITNNFSNPSKWALNLEHATVSRDYNGMIYGMFTNIWSSLSYIGKTYQIRGAPGSWTYREDFGTAFFPSAIQLDALNLNGYIFTTSIGTGYPNDIGTFKVCLYIEEPENG